MTPRLALLAALLALLLAADGWLTRREAVERQHSSRIERLVPDAPERPPLAVLRVRTGRGESFAYGRRDGLWHCLTWRGAPASRARIERVIDGLLGARGMVLADRPARPADFGLDGPAMASVSVHGPRWSPLDADSDLIAAFDVGAALPGGGGTFVRRRGETAVWLVDGDLAAPLARDDARRPPMIDPALVPGEWPGGSPRIRTLRVEHRNGEAFELILRESDLAGEAPPSGVLPLEWVLARDGREEKASQFVAVAWVAWILTARWGDILDPSLAPALDLEQPRAVLTLSGTGPAADGSGDPGDAPDETLRLALGGRSPAGRPAVAHSVARLIYELAPEQEALLFPHAADLLPGVTRNPWER